MKLLNATKKSLIYLLIIVPCFFSAQNNLHKNQMVSQQRNYTSFSAPPQKNIDAELLRNTPAKLKEHPELGINPYNTQCEDCYEVLEERTATTRHFVKRGTQGKTFYNQAGLNDINYKDANGDWRTIDPRMFPSSQEANVLNASSQPYPTRIDLNKKEVSVVNGADRVVFNRHLKLYHKTSGGTQLVGLANWSEVSTGSDGIYVKNIFPGIDLEVYALNGALKTNYIIKDKLSFSEGSLLIEDEMDLPKGTSFSTRFTSQAKEGVVGSLVVQSPTGEPLFEVGKAVGYDNSDHKANRTIDLSYKLNGSDLSIIIPVDWLNSNGLVYPVTIDPLVSSSGTFLQGSITGSGGNGSGSWVAAFACPYNLSVPTPANCTVTDIKWSFTYVAQNGAIKNDGAVDFLLGACRSPGNPSLFWTCQDGFPGNCIGTNISIFSDFSSCIPAPSCAPYNMNFKMRFYDAWGGACSNVFIGAASNWVMTIEGHTVEFTNPGSAISVSASTICFGQQITASTSSQYGVPAYSYNWSFNSSGTPSVGSGSSANISFPAPGTYTLYSLVTDACGQVVTANTTITVNPIPTLTVTASANPICLGQSSTLNASGATTYAWSANAGGGAGSSATVTPPVGTTVFTVTGTSLGCSNTGTVSVTVNPLPTVSASSSPVSVCAGQTATLTASGATTYTWSANAGSVQANTTTVSPTTTATYTVSATGNNGCMNSAQVTVTVTPSPTVAITNSPATICAGQNDTLTASGATSYTWSANAGGVLTPTAVVNPNATTTYTVTGSAGGCTSTQTVSVNVTPLPTLTVTSSPAAICSGGSATLTASGAATFTWSANAGGANTNTVSVTPGSTTSYTVSGTQSGCTNSTTISITVGTQPNVTASATSNTICSSQSTTLTASGATTYTWSPGGPGTSIVVTPNATTTYTVVGDNGGCTNTTMITVTVTPTPTVTANAAPANICSGSSTTLTASGATSFTWSPGGATTNTVSVSPTNTTTYTVTGDSLGCTSTQVVTVSVTPTPTVMAIAASPTVCSGQSIPIIAGGATTYTWSANAGGVTTQTVIVTPPANPTTYTVTGANGNCLGTATVSIGVITTPTISVASTSAAICSGQSDALNVNGATTYTWMPGNANTSTITVTPGSTTTYTVTGENTGCTDTQTITVTVNPTPTLSAVGSQAVCSGSMVNGINFASTGGTVSWANSNTAIGVAANGTGNISTYLAPNIVSQQIGVITATPAVAGTGCVGNSQTFTITINPSPSITPGTADSAKCGQPIGGVSGIVVNGGTPTYAYTWYSGSNVISGATTATLTGVNVGTYSLMVMDANGCMATSGPYSVGGSPGVTASFTATPLSGTAPLNVGFTNLSSGATIYNWNLGNGMNTVTNPATTYTAGGTYTVVLTASNSGGCTGTYTMTISVDQPISVVVPNVFSPNGDNINDEFFIVTSGVTSLNCDIFNRWGQKVYTIATPSGKWDGKMDNGHSATDGTYYYMLNAMSYDGKQHESHGYLQLVK